MILKLYSENGTCKWLKVIKLGLDKSKLSILFLKKLKIITKKEWNIQYQYGISKFKILSIWKAW